MYLINYNLDLLQGGAPKAKQITEDDSLSLTANEQGFMQVGEIEFRLPEPLLIENILMKLRTNAQ